ncbi:MAG: hypothetical protein JO107_02835 [Hyphomicrobiales bacterium]|nr:hypothetical protein [Hyphomicrobiales bacterium]MBV8662017.1 hypothetical protein [Hyphomicrobiales bacterium]
MTPAEIYTELKEIIRDLGPKCEAFADVSSYHSRKERAGRVVVYPMGLTFGERLSVDCDDFRDGIDKMRVLIADRREQLDAHNVRKIALAIMELAIDNGEVTDAAIRGRGFDSATVDRLGERACAEAERLAAGGPFVIKRMRGGNGAPVEAEAA